LVAQQGLRAGSTLLVVRQHCVGLQGVLLEDGVKAPERRQPLGALPIRFVNAPSAHFRPQYFAPCQPQVSFDIHIANKSS